MPVQLTPAECQQVDSIVRGQKRLPAEALVKINRSRKRRGVDPTSHNTVARYCKGQTHRRDVAEARGRPLALTPKFAPWVPRRRAVNSWRERAQG